MSNKLVEQFASLFSGYEKAHGEHELFDKADEHGKLKGRASTKKVGATLQHYSAHLAGSGTSLGVIPLRADDHCLFGAIDIDIQGEIKLNEPIETLEGRIRKMELPLVVCRSKSGGAHLYLFCSKPISAKLMVAKLTQFASALGYGGCEIFPKQVMRANEEDRGNWINIAFYGALAKEDTTRYCIRNGKPIKKLDEFLKYADKMRINNSELEKVELKLADTFSDGPPCLQHLATYGIEQGGRNTSLTNIAIYYKISSPDDWQDKAQQFAVEQMSPPVGNKDLQQIIRNVTRKDYFYTCKQPPLSTHCNKALCKTRKFGIGSGKDAELFPIDNLTKCESKDSVRWYAECDGKRIEVTTEQLLSQPLMQRVGMERLNKLFPLIKNAAWHERIGELMQSVTVVIDPEDASRQGQFENMLDNFFTNSRPARNKDELIKGNSFTENHRVFFRSEDLFRYLNVHRFTHTPHEVWLWLKQKSAEGHQMRIKGKMIRVWSLPEPEKFDGTSIDLPSNMEEEI